ncbi:MULTISPECIES: hypothetical protein [Butyricimonas]|uniref:hypothetical protein n=1 Tax=Butyricimonas TaxID=574697 RepID=UPI001D061276|nr:MULTISPECIES: hypothetical protein [Butyricimonas]MCB6972696.1 hypothetical protein [Butyricimonas synergistica]MCG4519704.1 hypothetical protein [Butyricimonas sp. DFI.6.44]
MKKILMSVVLIIACMSSFGQEEKKKFQITGKPIVTVFANYHAGLGDANKESGFALDRAYLGYQFSLTEKLSGKVVFDMGSTKVDGADLERVAYIKNAMLSWKTGDFTLDFGLIGLEQFNVQEKFWGYRYIMKSFQDEYKFGSSADMGILGRYKFTKWLSADITISNGEGYKKLNGDNKYRYAVGATLFPVKGLTIRAYYDLASKSSDADGLKDQQNLAFFAGYKHKLFSLGGEYDQMFNTKSKEDKDQNGFSVYSTVKLAEKFDAFGRYDNLASKDDWSSADGQRVLIGIQYSPIKQLKIAPNFSTWNPRDGKSSSFAYLNIEFKL